jgi:protein gp37
MGDLFHDDVPDEFIYEVYHRIMFSWEKKLGHIFMVLTKRPERMAKLWKPKVPLDNLWLGVTCENQQAADERIPILLQMPAAVRFVSVEPMLEPVDLSEWLKEVRYCERHGQLCDEGVRWENDQLVCKYCRRPVDRMRLLNWVIAGGETGPNARPMHPDWVRSLRDQCQEAGVPFFFKQWGQWNDLSSGNCVAPRKDRRVPWSDSYILSHRNKIYKFLDGCRMFRIGKKTAGRLLDGRTWDEFPEVR